MEKHIFDYLSSLEIPGIATFRNMQAIFKEQAPDDTDEGWSGGQYGRIVYELKLKDDVERKISGTFSLEVSYKNTEEGYADLLKARDILEVELDRVFFSDGKNTLSFSWRMTTAFSEKSGSAKDTEVTGLAIDYDVYAFPALTYEPMDPVMSLAMFCKAKWPEARVINLDPFEGWWIPTEDEPAVYVRLTGVRDGTISPNYACTWHMATLQVHIMTEANLENEMSLAIVHELTDKQRFRMNDGSPCFIDRVNYDRKADLLRDGRVTVNGQYGVLREIPEAEIIEDITMTGVLN